MDVDEVETVVPADAAASSRLTSSAHMSIDEVYAAIDTLRQGGATDERVLPRAIHAAAVRVFRSSTTSADDALPLFDEALDLLERSADPGKGKRGELDVCVGKVSGSPITHSLSLSLVDRSCIHVSHCTSGAVRCGVGQTASRS